MARTETVCRTHKKRTAGVPPARGRQAERKDDSGRDARGTLCVLVAVCCLLLPAARSAAAAAEPAKEQEKQGLNWHSDLGEAMTDARAKDLRLLMLLEAPEQLWSRQMLRAFEDAQVVAATGPFVGVRLNVRSETRLLEHLVVRIVPDLRVFLTDGREVAHETGILEPAALKKFLDEAGHAQPKPGAATLSLLLPSSDLDALLKLEAKDELPPESSFAGVLNLAGGPADETRLEAQRLLRKWARARAAALVAALEGDALKCRVTAFDALSDLGAPLESYDPWSAPLAKEQGRKLAAWARELAQQKPPAGAQTGLEALPAHLKAQVESDLKELGGADSDRAQAAWQRLVSVGPVLAPTLRQRARDVVAQAPAQAVRLDELRFRTLLSSDALRKQPGVAARLASGSP
ncbi:MAG: hypothetical protein ABSE73_18800, partial [Planctomycetota bacterium]